MRKRMVSVLLSILFLTSLYGTAFATVDNVPAESSGDNLFTASSYSEMVAFPEDEMARQLEYSEEVIQKHERYRKANNLDYSKQAILNALKSPNAKETIPKYSVALTEEEESYIQERRTYGQVW